jgi:hypothetical protein
MITNQNLGKLPCQVALMTADGEEMIETMRYWKIVLMPE